jgi:ferrochelatase
MNRTDPTLSPVSHPAAPLHHPEIPTGRVGVLLVNLGTPDGTDYRSMRRYLKEFLSDRRVIELPRLPWLLLLNLVILSTRPQRSGEAYEKIWDHQLDESPLRTITRSQAEKLGAALADDNPAVMVDWAMRYGNPPLAERLTVLKESGCDRVLVVPLYPQYSAATTGTVMDKLGEALRDMRWQPAIRTVPPYYEEPAYIEALARSLTDGLAALDFEPELVLTSYHGLPKEYVLKGDPYYCHCFKTTRLLGERLGWGSDRLRVTFQSRFGRAEWLQPYTDKTVEALAKSGVKRLAAIMPGFAADCVETLEEIGMQNAAIFKENGGEHFAAIPCLNDSEAGMTLLDTLTRNELKGWM